MTADPGSVVRDYWSRIWLDRDLSAIDDLVADPSVRHTVDGTESLTREALRARLSDALAAVRSESMSIDALTAVADTVWIRLTLHALSLATMAPLALTWIAEYRVVDGLIVESWALHQANLDWTRRQ